MSLNWRLTKIKDYEDLCWIEQADGTKRLNPVTESLIFATMSTGLGEIKESNAVEFLARWVWVERVSGRGWPQVARLFKNGYSMDDVTIEDIKAHIGLSTNVSDEPIAGWRRRLGEMYYKEIVYDINRSLKKVPA